MCAKHPHKHVGNVPVGDRKASAPWSSYGTSVVMATMPSDQDSISFLDFMRLYYADLFYVSHMDCWHQFNQVVDMSDVLVYLKKSKWNNISLNNSHMATS